MQRQDAILLAHFGRWGSYEFARYGNSLEITGSCWNKCYGIWTRRIHSTDQNACAADARMRPLRVLSRRARRVFG
jgi:hypothetical protein